jgi:hypothetical protein
MVYWWQNLLLKDKGGYEEYNNERKLTKLLILIQNISLDIKQNLAKLYDGLAESPTVMVVETKNTKKLGKNPRWAFVKTNKMQNNCPVMKLTIPNNLFGVLNL